MSRQDILADSARPEIDEATGARFMRLERIAV